MNGPSIALGNHEANHPNENRSAPRTPRGLLGTERERKMSKCNYAFIGCCPGPSAYCSVISEGYALGFFGHGLNFEVPCAGKKDAGNGCRPP